VDIGLPASLLTSRAMAAALRHALLASCLLATHARADPQSAGSRRAEDTSLFSFVPGGIGQRPHVHIRPPGTYALNGPTDNLNNRAGGRVLPPQRRAGMPRIMARMDSTEGITERVREIAIRTGVIAMLNTTMMIDGWIRDSGPAGARPESDDAPLNARVFQLARRQIDAVAPEYVFGLTAKKGSEVQLEDIQAMATIVFEAEKNQNFQQDQRANIGVFIVKPTADRQKDLGAELLRKIILWAARTNRDVSISQAEVFNDYYRNLGFDPKDEFWPYDTRYSVYELEDGREFRIVMLKS